MDDLVTMMEQFIHQSAETYKKWPYAGKAKAHAWRVCAALLKDGWKCTGGEQPLGSNSLNLVWSKQNEEDKTIKLSFVEQQLWLNYIEKTLLKKGEIIK